MILLTGATGFLGRAIAAKLGDEVITVGRNTVDDHAPDIVMDLSSEYAASSILKQVHDKNITRIIHAAGVTPWAADPDYAKDLQMAQTMVEVCKGLSAEYLYYVSGWIVYDATAPVPYTEATPLLPGNSYGESKLAVEAFFGAHLQNTKLVSLRLSSLYGPGQTAPGLIPNLVLSALRDKKITLKAKDTRRDYVYIDDCIQAISDLLKLSAGRGEAINIGGGVSVAVEKVAETIIDSCKRLYGFDVSLVFDTDIQEAKPRDNALSVTHAQSLGLLKSITPFESGLEAYIDWEKNEAVL